MAKIMKHELRILLIFTVYYYYAAEDDLIMDSDNENETCLVAFLRSLVYN